MALDISTLSAQEILALENQIAAAKDQTKAKMLEELAQQIFAANKAYKLPVADVAARARALIAEAKEASKPKGKSKK